MASGVSLRVGPAPVPASAPPRSADVAPAQPSEPAPGLPAPDLVAAVAERLRSAARAALARLERPED